MQDNLESQSAGEEALAASIAEQFADQENIQNYQIVCQKYPKVIVEKALKRTAEIPDEKIKKSRSALFFYLVRQYAHQRPDSARR